MYTIYEYFTGHDDHKFILFKRRISYCRYRRVPINWLNNWLAVRTIVLSRRHGSSLARPVIIHDIIHSLMCMPSTPHCGFSGVPPDGNCAYIRPLRFFYVQLKVSQTSHLIYVVLWAQRHDIAARCPSVYGIWQAQAITHPTINRARRCSTSVIEPTPMRQRRIPYITCFYMVFRTTYLLWNIIKTVISTINESIKFDQTSLILSSETHWVGLHNVFATSNQRHWRWFNVVCPIATDK